MARKKVYKVKHFRSPYHRKNNKKLIKIALIVLGCVVVFAISFAVLGPLTDMLYNKVTTPDAPSLPAVDNSSAAPSDEVVPPVTPVETISSNIRYITEEEILAIDSYDALVEKIKTDGFSAAAVPLKTAEGIYFSTENELAIRTKAVSQSADVLISKLKAAEIKTIGTFETFKDDKLPRLVYGTENISMAVRFKNDTSYLMLNGTDRITWLSPASDKTKDYLSSLAADAAKTGVDEIIFKSFWFVDNSNAAFSDDDTAIDKSALLTSFSAALKEAVPAEISVSVSFEVSAEDYIVLDENKYGTSLFEGEINIKAASLSEELKSAIAQKGEREIIVCAPSFSEEDIAFLKEKGVFKLLIG